MKLLVYQFGSYLDYDICDVLSQMGIGYDKFEYNMECPGHDKNHDDEFVDYFISSFDTNKYDAVFSIDYWPPIAVACHKKNIKYIAWSYDCPLDIKNPGETLVLPNVTLFVFDKAQYVQFKDDGFDNVYYMPLGVNVKRYEKINSTAPECNKYRSQVSFIGKLYENSFPLIYNLVNEKTRVILDSIIETQRKMPQNYMLSALVTDSFAELINTEMHDNDPEFHDVAAKNKIIYAIESQISRLDRIMMLNLCGRRYKTNFYSDTKFDLLEGVGCHPPVNYWNEMPWIFAASDINLNPMLMSIRNGLNLRAFDIPACGGFMMINRLPVLEELYTDKKEVVAYDSVYDFIGKAEYYISHEDKRLAIAHAGRERCFSEHSMISRLKDIFRKAEV